MGTPVIAKKGSYKIAVQKGKKYFWCSCGLSSMQPFCDGAHKGSGMSPVCYEAQEDREMYFCGCKASKKGAFCDGSHREL